MLNSEVVLQQFDQLYREQSAYYHGAGATDNLTVSIIYLWPDGTLEARRFQVAGTDVKQLRRQNAIAEEVCAFSNVYPDGVYGGSFGHTAIRLHLEQQLRNEETDHGKA